MYTRSVRKRLQIIGCVEWCGWCAIGYILAIVRSGIWCIIKNKPKLRMKHVLKFLPQNRAQGHATAFGSTGYFAGWGAASQRHGLLGSVKTEYPNDGSGLPSKSDHIWSCRPPPFKKDNGIFGLTTGDYIMNAAGV